jgi:hypothetical protein
MRNIEGRLAMLEDALQRRILCPAPGDFVRTRRSPAFRRAQSNPAIFFHRRGLYYLPLRPEFWPGGHLRTSADICDRSRTSARIFSCPGATANSKTSGASQAQRLSQK